ncbi:MAG: glycoside hydrolase family 57 protein [Thiobacillaceae bacterium]|nr:glycoside hydrolase family 57 protein [Thiobacillaceae bacterium]
MLDLVLCWHFHQPDYRDESGFVLPWTYLHALKDYSDMAAHLEAQPAMRCVVNFVPSLLEQLDDYAQQFERGVFRDPLPAALAEPRPSRWSRAQRLMLVQTCFRLHPPTMLEPFPAYKRLHALWQQVRDQGAAAVDYLSTQYFVDLVTWYHLAWTGESLRRSEPLVLALMQKGSGFTLEERRALLELAGRVVRGLIPRYRALAERGQIELSATPHSHPLAPLLIDFSSAREVRPELVLPRSPAYPGGAVRLAAHIEAALRCHREHFGAAPTGLWPAEGAVSEAAVAVFAQAPVRWIASGEGVLRASLKASGLDVSRPCQWLCRPWRVGQSALACFFRDDYLSDLIGFEYKNWFARDAVRHFLHSIEDRYHYANAPAPVVSVILDGENAWDHYPYNGWYFLSELYAALVEHPAIRLTTFSEYLERHPDSVLPLPKLVAGSWVYGDLTTWIGQPDKNRAWDLLCAAKQAYDTAVGGLDEAGAAAAEALLRSCESSDWFWWFGDANPAESVRAFDRLFRGKLKRLYALLGLAAPAELDTAVSAGGGPAELGGVMRRGVEG